MTIAQAIEDLQSIAAIVGMNAPLKCDAGKITGLIMVPGAALIEVEEDTAGYVTTEVSDEVANKAVDEAVYDIAVEVIEMATLEIDDWDTLDEEARLNTLRKHFTFRIHDSVVAEAWNRALEEAAEA